MRISSSRGEYETRSDGGLCELCEASGNSGTDCPNPCKKVIEEPAKVTDTGPAHYTRLQPQPLDVINAWKLGFNLGNVVKYISRAGFKEGASPVEDLKKALVYLQREIEERA